MNTEQEPIHSGFGETTTADEVIRGRDLKGKAVVVTGGHSGIGLETTRVLSTAGATIVIGARDLTKARQAVSQIKNVEIYETRSCGTRRKISPRISSMRHSHQQRWNYGDPAFAKQPRLRVAVGDQSPRSLSVDSGPLE